MNTSRVSFRLAAAATAAISLAAAGCTQTTDLERAQTEVKAKTEAVEQAKKTYDTSRTSFCGDATVYVSALDRYSKLFTESTATVGDVRSLGSDLERPRSNVMSSAQDAVDANTALVESQASLAKARLTWIHSRPVRPQPNRRPRRAPPPRSSQQPPSIASRRRSPASRRHSARSPTRHPSSRLASRSMRRRSPFRPRGCEFSPRAGA